MVWAGYTCLKFFGIFGRGGKNGIVRTFSSKFNESTIKVKDANINYIKAGHGSHPVLCLPGALGTIWSDFKPQIEGFNHEKYQVVVWDPPGYGKSRPPDKKFDVNFYHTDADYAGEMMKILGYKKYSVLGWSDGGITGMILAALNNDVDKLVVWGANAYVTDNDIQLYKGIQDTSKWSEKMRKPLVDVYGAEALQSIMTSWYNALKDIQDKRSGDICRNLLQKIKSPTLVLHGVLDPLVPAEHPDYLISNINSAKRFDFEKGKHNIHLRYAEEFNKVVQSFLEE